MTERIKEWSANDIANDLGVQLHRVLYIIDSRQMQSIGLLGGRRVFSQAQKDEIEKIERDSKND